MFATTPENELVVERLTNALIDMSIGSTLAYSTLNDIAGCKLDDRRSLLKRARERAEISAGAMYEAVRGVGIKRLNASDSPEVGLGALRSCRRKARKGARRLNRINSNSLSDQDRKRVIAYGSLLGAIATVADGNKARTVAAVVIDTVNPIPPKDVLKMFMD